MTSLSLPVVCRKNRPPDLLRLSFISSGKVIALRFLLVVAQIGVPQICLQWKVWTLDWRNILRLAHRQYFEYFEYLETCSPPCLGGGSPCGRGAAGCSSPERSFDIRVIFSLLYLLRISAFVRNWFLVTSQSIFIIARLPWGPRWLSENGKVLKRNLMKSC